MQAKIDLKLINEYGTPGVLLTMDDRQILLEAGDLDRLIETLGSVRVELSPPPTSDISREARYQVETNPDWLVHHHVMHDGLMLFLRHSGYGWLGYGLSPECVAELMHTLEPTFDAFPTDVSN